MTAPRVAFPFGRSAPSATGEGRGTWWFVVVLVGAVLVRIAFLSQPMRQDEADTVVLFALTPLRHILVDTSIPNNHILHTLLVKGSIGAFGLEAWVVRLPAFLAGGLVVVLTWLAGRRLYNARAGLVAAALVAVSTPMILYSTNARGYTLIAAAMLLALLSLCVALGDGNRRAWVVFACAIAAGAFVNPSMLYPAGGIVIWALLELLGTRPVPRRGIRELVLACAAAGVMTLVAYAPAIKVSGWRSIVSNEYVRPVRWSVFLGRLPEFAGDFLTYLGAGLPLGLQLLLGVALVAGWILHRRQGWGRWPVSLVALAWALLLLVAMRRAPFLRVWLFLIPLFALSAGAAIEAMLSRVALGSAMVRVGVASALVTMAMGLALVRQRAPDLIGETGRFPDGPAVADSLGRLLAPGDLVVAQWLAQGPVDFYLRRLGVMARWAVHGDSGVGRVFLVPTRGLDETPASIVEARRLVNVDATRAREVATFPGASIWVVPPMDSLR